MDDPQPRDSGQRLQSFDSPHHRTSNHSSDMPVLQTELESQLKEELLGSTFEAPCSSFGETQLLEPHIKRILAHLANDGWEHSTFVKSAASKSSKSPDINQWPAVEDERAFYDPICSLFNDAVQGFSSDVTAKGASYHASRGLLFSVYDRPMEGLQTAAGLKPDIVGCHGKPPGNPAGSKKEKIKAIALTWGKTEIAVEVKGDSSLMMIQATTYARALVLSRKSRLWALVIAFNQKKVGVRFNFFHRGGLMSTEMCDLKTPKGFSDFIRMMAFVLSWESTFEAGMDPTRDDITFWLPNLGKFEYIRELCLRTTLCGRSTEVVLLRKGVDGQASTAPAHVAGQDATRSVPPETIAAAPAYRRVTRNSAKNATNGPRPPSPTPASGGIKRRITDQLQGTSKGTNNGSGERGSNKRRKVIGESDATITEEDVINELKNISRERNNPNTLEEPSVHLLDHWHEIANLAINLLGCVFKDSWPFTKRKASERDMLRDTKDKFGLPEVIYSYEVFYAKQGDHSFPVPDGAKYYNPFGGKGPETIPIVPEPRTHTRSIFRTVGERLEQAKGPKHLIIAIIHAMIGYLNAFLAEWLHRDISDGNVLIATYPRPASETTGEKFSQIQVEGFLTDGDQAIKWKEAREGVPYGSGTAPFMSIRALNHWLKGLKKVEKHTAIDDLESFMWLLIWYLLQAGHSSQSLSEEEQAAFNNFDSASYNQVLMIKYELRTMLVDYDSSMPPPFNTVAFLAPFMGILKPWADTIIKAQKLMANIVVQAYRQNAMDNTTTHKTMEDLCIKALNECINTGLKEVEGIKENWDDYKLSK